MKIDIIEKAVQTRDRITELLERREAIDLELEELLGSKMTSKKPSVVLDVSKKKRGPYKKKVKQELVEKKQSNKQRRGKFGEFGSDAIKADIEAEVAPIRVCGKYGITMKEYYGFKERLKKEKPEEGNPINVFQTKVKHYRNVGLGIPEIAMTLKCPERQVEEAIAWLDK